MGIWYPNSKYGIPIENVIPTVNECALLTFENFCLRANSQKYSFRVTSNVNCTRALTFENFPQSMSAPSVSSESMPTNRYSVCVCVGGEGEGGGE